MVSPVRRIVVSSALLTSFFLSCETPTDFLNPIRHRTPRELVSRAAHPSKVVSLAVGNKYLYWDFFVDSSGTGSDDGHPEYITDTAMLGGEVWYRFTEGELRRADSIRLYRYQNGHRVIEMDYTLAVGDTFRYHPQADFFWPKELPFLVLSRQSGIILGSREEVFRLVDTSASDSTIYYLAYATRFGLLWTGRSSEAFRSGTDLIAAIVDGKKYGDTASLAPVPLADH